MRVETSPNGLGKVLHMWQADVDTVDEKEHDKIAQEFVKVSGIAQVQINWTATHLNREEVESNLSAPGIQGHQEDALIKSFEMSPHLICL